MGSEKPNRRDAIAEQYLDMVAADGRRQRLQEQRYARLLIDTYGIDPARVCHALGLTAATLDRMLAVDGRPFSAECAQNRHAGCHGARWNDAGDEEPCACECHQETMSVVSS